MKFNHTIPLITKPYSFIITNQTINIDTFYNKHNEKEYIKKEQRTKLSKKSKSPYGPQRI